MKIILGAAPLAAFLLSVAAPVAAPAMTTSVFEGTIVHISSGNIKVKNATQSLSFLLVPKFDQVFSDDGKTTYQMAKLHSGQLVKVFYDQKALGARHADRIVVLTRGEKPVKSMKS